MKILFWVSLLVVAYTYAGYPVAIAIVAKLWARTWTRQAWEASTSKPISIVMAVHNGAMALEEKLHHLLSIEPDLVHEVIVVSDGSTDATAQILQANSNEKLRSVLLPKQVGKAAAVNEGISAATSEIIVFVDIRPWISARALSSLLANFSDPTVGCVAGELLLKTDEHDATAAAVSGFYWRYEQWIRNCEAAWDSPVGVYGGFYAVRRSLASTVPPGTILDDMFQPLSVIRQGYRSVLDRTAVVTDSWPVLVSGEFSRKVRTLAGNFQLLALAPWIVTPKNRVFVQLISHKLLRLVVPYLFLTMLLSSAWLGTHSAVYLTLFALQLAFWILAVASLLFRVPVLHRIGSPASALLMLNAAAVKGLYTFCFTRGPLWNIWSPTKLRNAS